MQSHTSRRSFLSAAAILAAAPGLRAQTPAVATRRIGDLTLVPLLDGLFPLELAVMPEADGPEGKRLLTAASLPPNGPVMLPVKAFAVKRGERVWLIDAGCGTAFGPDLGRAVATELGAAAIDPAKVEAVLLTHLHVDHAGGVLTPDGKARFAQAELVVQEAEIAFWTDAGIRSRAPADAKLFFDVANAALDAYKGRVRPVAGAKELAPGMTAVPLPGHTPGHAGVMLESGGERLLVWGDVVHAAVLQFAHPEWTLIFDVDRPQAAASRARVLDMAASDKVRVAGMHLAETGMVERRGSGYALAS